jgi:hypothetical protein
MDHDHPQMGATFKWNKETGALEIYIPGHMVKDAKQHREARDKALGSMIDMFLRGLAEYT